MVYLWVHLAGLALVPLFLQMLWLALAISQPLPFFWLELVLLVIVGLFPIVFLQWNKPFSPFNLLFFTTKINSLTEDDRRLLTPLKSTRQRFLSAIASIVSLIILWGIYLYAPLAREAASFLPQFRLFGLLIALIAFFLANLFLQVSVSVFPLIISKPETLSSLEPYPADKIKQDFTVFGFPLTKILPPLT
jgi:hypothetical protein